MGPPGWFDKSVQSPDLLVLLILLRIPPLLVSVWESRKEQVKKACVSTTAGRSSFFIELPAGRPFLGWQGLHQFVHIPLPPKPFCTVANQRCGALRELLTSPRGNTVDVAPW